jgi:hypothetical protein
MSKSKLLQFCRFFKGEAQNPFEGKVPEKAQLWNWEAAWVSFADAAFVDENCEKSQVLSFMIREFIDAGLSDFQSMDGRPATLKAFLFNRFSHWDEGGDFKRWYVEKYSKL